MGKPHRHFTAQQKVSILREHLLDGAPISDVCEKHQLALTIFYRWQKAFFENGGGAAACGCPRPPTVTYIHLLHINSTASSEAIKATRKRDRHVIEIVAGSFVSERL
jgi:transposase-like protein